MKRNAPPGAVDRALLAIAGSVLKRIEYGSLRLELPGLSPLTFGRTGTGPDALLEIHHPRLLRRLALDGEIGLGEGFVAGEWSSPDVTQLIRLLAANQDRLQTARWMGWPGRMLNRARHRRRPNTRRGSQDNIRAHYDQGNDFFKLFLDSSMMYSCALYGRPGDSLEHAQRNKLDSMIEKAGIRRDDHVLEIGSGWGAFAIHAARITGCRVTGITLSKEQLSLSRRRAAEAGLSDRVQFALCDYRDVQGSFDAIVSIEMIEAVGHSFLTTFFNTCDRVLRPGGRVALQAITIRDDRYDHYRSTTDWIQKHVFPGGHLPSIAALRSAMASNFAVQKLESIGLHYARTLADWRERLLQHTQEARSLGADEAQLRSWVYYFSFCEAGFLQREVDTMQMVLTRRERRI